MTSTTHARHRAARRPVTPLTSIASAASDSMSSVGRRTIAVAASSGLIVSMLGAFPASAAPSDSAKLNAVDLSALTAQARAALESAPVVTVAADATWGVEYAAVAVTPAPEPPPVVVKKKPVVTRTEQRADRTQERESPVQQQEVQQEQAQTQEVVKETVKEPVSQAPASANGSAVIAIASRYVGVPYVYGGSTPNGFDCSGFTSYVFAQVGINLPRSSGAQGAMGTRIPRSQAQPGDLIWTPGHVAIYAGGNQQIDAPRPGKTIQFREIWQSNPTFIRLG